MTKITNKPRENRQRGRITMLLVRFCAPVIGGALVVGFIYNKTQGPHEGALSAEILSKSTTASSTVARGFTDRQQSLDPETDNFLRRFGASLDSLQNGQDPMEREEELHALLESISLGQISAVLDFLKGAKQTATVREVRALLVRRWAEHDPKAAAVHASELPAGEQRQEAFNQVAIAWANSDAAGVREWSAGIASVAEQQEVYMAVANEWTRTQPVEAIGLVLGLPPDARRDDILCRAVAEWTTVDPHEAIAWARHHPDESIRDKFMAAALTAWANQEPLSAARLAMCDLHTPRLQAGALASIAQHWAQQDPSQVTEELEKLAPNELQRGVVKNVLTIWEQELGSSLVR